MIEPAATPQATGKVRGDKAKAKAMTASGRLVDARMRATGVLASGLLRINGAVVDGDQSAFFQARFFNCRSGPG